MLRLIKQMLNGLSISIDYSSNRTKCVLLSNQKCMTPFTVINLHPNGFSQELNYYQFVFELDRCAGSCNTLKDLHNKVCVPNKT